MKMHRRKLLGYSGTGVLLLPAVLGAAACPKRHSRLITRFPAGGAADIAARTAASPLSQQPLKRAAGPA
jgi:tripartite-type tricarboxylate transporter receptor subunit TctC